MSARRVRWLAPAVFVPCLSFPAWASDCTKTSVGKTPLNDLASGLYQGRQAGLYPGGSNKRPASHDAALDRSGRIMLLDAAGRPDPERGTVVLLSIGMSSATEEFSVFKQKADSDSRKNSRLVIVDGAEKGQDAQDIRDPNADYWRHVDQKLMTARVTPLQVQAVWLKEGRRAPTETFPEDAVKLRDDLAAIVRIIKRRYPNTRSVYLSSRTYGGYATTHLNPEPYAYQSGFAVKWLVEQQLNRDPSLNFDPSRGLVRAPWLSWGPYWWADGLRARSDGLTWACQDFVDDGTHPSASGQDKASNQLLAFFKSDSTTLPWFTDCNTSDPSTFAAPPEVRNVRIRKLSAASVELSWDSLSPVVGSGAVYDVIYGRLTDLRRDRGFDHATCLVTGWSDRPFVHSFESLEGTWYLLRGRDSCGRGTWGDSTLVPDVRDRLDSGAPACP